MLTKQDNLVDFLGQEGVRFTIPVYQRAYAWTKRQCKELLDDIMRAGQIDAKHFMSMILFLEAEADEEGVRSLDIIDGQQRIATSIVMLCALADCLRKRDDKVCGLGAQELTERFLVAGKKAPTCKIALLGVDGATLEALVLGRELPAKTSARIMDNYRYFQEAMGADDFDLEQFWRGVEQLVVIDAELDKNDKAQAIFEGLNTKGLPLTTADLVRNYLLVAQESEEQERLYEEYWNPIELMFGEDKGSLKLNAGIRMWLSIRFRKMRIHDKSQTYNAFKAYMTEEYDGTTEELLDELRSFCLMWAENYKFNEVKEFRCMDWAKKGQNKTLLPGWGHQSGF